MSDSALAQTQGASQQVSDSAAAPSFAPTVASWTPTARMPASIRNGIATMVVQAVEPNVSREEVTAAVQGLIFNAPACIQMPALWLEQSDRPNEYLVRFDLMARDWGEPAAAGAAARLDEFIDLGFFTKRDRPSVGPGVVEITMTASGRVHIRGRISPGVRPSFCGPSERRLVEITSMEFGRFPCGTLRVHFTHVADDWPTWARGDAARARLAANWPQPGESGEGTVSLGRQWYREDSVPRGFENGSLQSLCYQRERRVADDDLDLTVMRPPE
jgi:hypothetical protein